MSNQYQEINQYVKTCWDKVEEYRTGVKNGSIIVNEYMKAVVEWFRETDEWEIKPKKVDRFFRFCYLVNISIDGEGYQRIELMPWQAFLFTMTFGMYHRGTNRRRFSESFTFMGRGNTKTTSAIVTAEFFLLGYNLTSPQAIIISTVENRRKVIDDLHKTVMHSPELFQFLHFNNGAVMLNTYDSNIKRGERPIKFLNDVGSIRVVPADDKKIDGLELVLAFIDEIHLLKDEMVFRNAQKSAAKRKDSLIMLMSTAGFQTEGFCAELVDRAKKVAMGEIKDDKFLPFLFCLDKTDDKEDIGNKTLWYKCNPSLGQTKTLEKMEAFYNDAKYSPKAKADFKTKDLNIFIDYNEEEVLSVEHRIRAGKKVDLDKWEGKDCYLGLDLSKVNDLSSLVALFHDEETDMWEAYPWYWIGNESKFLTRKGGENLQIWIETHKITQCDKAYIDYSLIAEQIRECSERFNIVGIGYDPYGWNEFRRYIENLPNLGDFFEVKQWTRYMAEPLSKILIQMISGKLIYSDNPVMTWNWKNARIKIADSNGNLKIFRNESRDSQDGCIAMVNAMALYFHKNFDHTAAAY